MEGRVPDVLDEEAVRDFRIREFDERACPFCGGDRRELWGCTRARAVASLLEEPEEERECIRVRPLVRFDGTTVWVDAVERDDDEDEEGAGE